MRAAHDERSFEATSRRELASTRKNLPKGVKPFAIGGR
jgi:hypothetical protein